MTVSVLSGREKMVAVDSASALRERHICTYTVTLESEAAAQAFARDFSGMQNGRQVTVKPRQVWKKFL